MLKLSKDEIAQQKKRDSKRSSWNLTGKDQYRGKNLPFEC